VNDKTDVISFKDTDTPGERIRSNVNKNIPECKYAFLTKEEAKEYKSRVNNLGIENAPNEIIRKALSQVYETEINHKTEITKNDLIKYGLIGGIDSKARREELGKRLRIGYANGKQLLKRLSMFDISKEQLIEEVKAISAGERDKND